MLEEPVYLALPSAGFVLQSNDCCANPALGDNVSSAANQQGRINKIIEEVKMKSRYRMRFSYSNLSGPHIGERIFCAPTDEDAKGKARKWVDEKSKGWDMRLLGLRRIIQSEESICIKI